MISLGSGGSAGGHPVIPDLFVWRDVASDTQVLFAHDHGYGGGLHVLPSNGKALYCAWNTDNGGTRINPHLCSPPVVESVVSVVAAYKCGGVGGYMFEP